MATLTYKHGIDNAQSFVDAVESDRNSYYVWVGRPYPWDDEAQPPASNSSIDQVELSIYDDIVYGKLIFPQNINLMIRRNDWANNVIYDQYDQYDGNLQDKNFFVLTEESNVYKVIDNAGGSPSTVKPSLTTTSGTFNTSDGYVWKYMYTLDPTLDTTFTSIDYIPLTPNTDVKNNAVVGSLDYIRVNVPGQDYRTYHTGYIQSVVNNYVIQLANSASTDDGFYTNSAIYLKAGGGAGQLRRIRQYSGLDRRLTVSAPFDTYVTLNLTDVQGSILLGQTVTQRLDTLSVLYRQGYFNIGDVVTQSDTGANGTIVSANNTSLVVVKSSSNSFSTNVPLYNTNNGGTLKSGNVTISSTSNVVTGTGTTFTTDYTVGQYIRVGTDQNKNIRRVTGITNGTYLTVASNFVANASANVHYLVPYAATPTAYTVQTASGEIVDTNLNGLFITYANPSTTQYVYTVGEKVDMVNGSGISQLANGTVTYSNSSTVILSDVNGTFTSGFYLKGLSSLLLSDIVLADSFPNITLATTTRAFVSGQRVVVSTAGSNTGNAQVATSLSIPNENTEYIISPYVQIDGDGTGAKAYSDIDPATNTVNRIVMLNTGTGYTKANVSLVANSIYGSNSSLSAVISPVNGHGSSASDELGAKYVGISMTFDIGENESYKLPTYGSYRRVGVIENPKFKDAVLELDSFDRIKFGLANTLNLFTENEIVIQPESNAAGIMVYSNSTFMELKNVKGTFFANTANTQQAIYGLSSGATSNVITADVNYFSLLSNAEYVTESGTKMSARINQVISNTSIRLTDIYGHLNVNDILYDTTSNAYANVVSITTANGIVDSSANFGHRFNQSARITLSSNTDAYELYEVVTQQNTSIPPVVVAQGRVYSTTDEVDLDISISTGSFSVGQELTAMDGGTGIITFANSSYLKLTGASGSWFVSDTINTITGEGSINAYYPCLVLHDVQQTLSESSEFRLVGANSGAIGVVTLPLAIKHPDLIRETGKVLYTNNILPFEKAADSQEEFRLVIKF